MKNRLLLTLLALVCVLCCTFCFVACEPNNNPDDDNKPNTTPPQYTEGLNISKESTYAVVEGIGTAKDSEIIIPSEYEGLPVTEISGFAFRYTGITKVEIPDTVTLIGINAFESSDLVSVKIAGNANLIINDKAFYNCKSLTIAEIDAVNKIEKEAFRGCANLTKLTLGKGLKQVGQLAFYELSKLEEVHITDVADWCKVEFHVQWAHPLLYAKKMYLNDILITELTVPDSVSSITVYAFINCESITSVDISEGVEVIGALAFSNCANIESVRLPKSLNTIDVNAFSNCSKLTRVTYAGTKSEWAEIEKGESWNSNTAIVTVHCEDGDIEL